MAASGAKMLPPRWTADEDAVLREQWKKGKADPAIAEILHRSRQGVRLRRKRIGLAHNGRVCGEDHGRSKLCIWDIAAIRLVFEEEHPPTVRSVARAFDVTPRAVRAVRDRVNWGWL